jgi:hypothetical protein
VLLLIFFVYNFIQGFLEEWRRGHSDKHELRVIWPEDKDRK